MKTPEINKLKNTIKHIKTNYKKLSEDELKKSIESIFRASSEQHFMLNSFSLVKIILQKKGLLWRVRVLDKPIKRLTEDDLWAPPPSIASAGRANHQGQNLLYTSNCLKTSILETQSCNKLSLILAYKITKPIEVRSVGKLSPKHRSNLPNHKAHETVTRFLKWAIKQKSNSSHIMTRILFNEVINIGDNCEGWAYNSTHNQKTTNYCFKPTINSKLEVVDIFLKTNNQLKGYYTKKNCSWKMVRDADTAKIKLETLLLNNKMTEGTNNKTPEHLKNNLETMLFIDNQKTN